MRESCAASRSQKNAIPPKPLSCTLQVVRRSACVCSAQEARHLRGDESRLHFSCSDPMPLAHRAEKAHNESIRQDG